MLTYVSFYFLKFYKVFFMFWFTKSLPFENWPAPPDDPQGIRVASVIEFSVCLCVYVFWANFLIYLYSQNIAQGQ